jgi:hypothetical protein
VVYDTEPMKFVDNALDTHLDTAVWQPDADCHRLHHSESRLLYSLTSRTRNDKTCQGDGPDYPHFQVKSTIGGVMIRPDCLVSCAAVFEFALFNFSDS